MPKKKQKKNVENLENNKARSSPPLAKKRTLAATTLASASANSNVPDGAAKKARSGADYDPALVAAECRQMPVRKAVKRKHNNARRSSRNKKPTTNSSQESAGTVEIAAAAVDAVAALPSCDVSDPETDSESEEPSVASPLPEQVRVIARSAAAFSQEFALQALESVAVCSPAACHLALACLLLGTSDQEARELAQVLHLPENLSLVTDGLSGLVRKLQRNMSSGSSVRSKVRFVTRLLLPRAPITTFQGEAHRLLHCVVRCLDSDPRAARSALNHEMEKKTHGDVTNIAPLVRNMKGCVLVTALHISAAWLHPCHPGETTPGQFHPPAKNRRSRKVSFMKMSGFLGHGTLNDGTTLLQLPCRDDELSLLVFLPPATASLMPILESLGSPRELRAMMEALSYDSFVHLTLPKFKLKANLDLHNILNKLGACSVFTPRAGQLDGMCTPGPACSSLVLHGAALNIGEMGIGISESSVEDVGRTVSDQVASPMLDIHVDRPFLALLVCELAEQPLVLLAAKVTDP